MYIPKSCRSEGYLLLEDGTRFDGQEFIGNASGLGEAVFNTSHSGYQEILTDPSYHRQIVTFTFPHIGSTGINEDDYESSWIYSAGIVVRQLIEKPRNWRSSQSFRSWIEKKGVPLLTGVDTRSITAHLRSRGAMRSGIFLSSTEQSEALDIIKNSPSMTNLNLANEVTTDKIWNFELENDSTIIPENTSLPKDLHAGVLDFGVKRNILRELSLRGCRVSVLPSNTSAEEIIDLNLDGILLSNGPGDPASVTEGIKTASDLIGKIPMFGICLGHQIISIAAGLSTYKLQFGHRGANHPVKNLLDDTVEITSQNHGFAVQNRDIPNEWQISHLNLNDNTVEGIIHKEHPVFSIQYHPEASPGPHEGHCYFDKFIKNMEEF